MADTLIEKVVIIIPTYNEGLTIKDTVTRVFETLNPRSDVAVHLLIFDSASTDDTQNIVRAMQVTYKTLHLQSEPEKTGLGSAYFQAMHYALDQLHADVVIEFDADLSHQPKYLNPMLDKIKIHDVVVGSRYVPGGSIPKDWSWNRKLFSILGNSVARLVLTRLYKDFTSGFRASRRGPLTQSLSREFLSRHYAYKLDLFWRLIQNKAEIVELPIEFLDRQKGDSKLPANTIKDSLNVLFQLRWQAIRNATRSKSD